MLEYQICEEVMFSFRCSEAHAHVHAQKNNLVIFRELTSLALSREMGLTPFELPNTHMWGTMKVFIRFVLR